MTNHLASDIKAVWRKISSSDAALECTSSSHEFKIDFLFLFLIGVYKLNVLRKMDRKENSFYKHIIGSRIGVA